MLDFSAFFQPWLAFVAIFSQPTYIQEEGEKLSKLGQHLELLGKDYAEKLTKTLATPLTG